MATLIESQTVPNPMKKGHFFTNMTELLWSDNTTTFGCLICGMQTEVRPQMSIHIGKTHNAKPTKVKKTKAVAQPNKAIGQVEKLIQDLTSERDHYKALARKYARQLNTLRQVFDVDKELL